MPRSAKTLAAEARRETPAFPSDAVAAMFSESTIGCCVLESGVMIYYNYVFCDVFALPENKIITTDHIARAVITHTHNDTIEAYIAARQPATIEFQAASTQNWYTMTLSPHAHNEQQMMIMVQDISALQHRNELAILSSKMDALGRLAGGVAHDFNNILSIIEGYGRLLSRTMKEGSEEFMFAKRIVQAAQRGAGITRQLLTFGAHRINTNAAICLREFLEDQQALLEPLLNEAVTLRVACPYERLLIAADFATLSQIIINAVTNARDAIGGEDGQISITARDNGKDVLLTITDTGCGMDKGTLQKAMEPFFTTKQPGKGTGLGLSQIYGLMKQMGGSVSIKSKAGRGTQLMLSFQRGDPQLYKPQEKVQISEPVRGQTVLIADDEPDLIDVMRRTLEEYGFNVLCAANGDEALDIQDRFPHKIDWLLSDVVMPGMTGPKLGQLMESVRPDTKTIYMSGYPASGQMARVELPKNATFLAKPLDPQQLLAVMASFTTDDQPDGEDTDGLARLAGTWRDK